MIEYQPITPEVLEALREISGKREITNEDRCKFVLWVGNKRLIKRRLFDQFIEQAYSI